MMPGIELKDAVKVLADEIRGRGLMVWLSDRPIISMTLHEQYPDIHTRWAGYHVWLTYSRHFQQVDIMLKETPFGEEKAEITIPMDWSEFSGGLMLAATKFFVSVGHKPDRAGQ